MFASPATLEEEDGEYEVLNSSNGAEQKNGAILTATEKSAEKVGSFLLSAKNFE
jgi:hypothetical protein